ncbi:MAG: hypothetical protein R3C39_15030 [Dehalococcoidia bacterium]
MWAGFVLASLGALVWDLTRANAGLPSLMKFVWGATVLYSGPVGLAIYRYAGRGQIPEDSCRDGDCDPPRTATPAAAPAS